MERNYSSHWFMKEEWNWRSIAAAVWSCFATVPVAAIFIFGITIDLSRHIFIFSDFVGSIFSLQFFMVCCVSGLLSSLLVALYSRHLKVSDVVPSSRVQLIAFFLQPSSLMFLLTSTSFFYIVSGLLISLRSSSRSIVHSDEHYADDNETERWLMADHISTMTKLFCCTVGLFYSFEKLISRKMQLQFLKVQEAKFLYLKCKFPCVLSVSGARSAHYLYYFLIMYYVLEFAIITIVSSSNLSIFSVIFSFRLWWIFEMIPLLWCLWLTGTWCLFLYDMSWHILNAFQTQIYPFPLANSLFSVDEERLLVKNLHDAAPTIVQHHAFHALSLMVKQDASKRRHIFSLSCGIENGQPVICNIIMKSCLDRVRKLTEDITKFHSSLFEAKNPHTSLEEQASNTPLKNDNITEVTTPRLWARFHESRLRHREFTPSKVETPKTPRVTQKFNISGIFTAAAPANAKPQKAPVRVLQNVYCDHMIVKWSLQTVSYLCIKSVDEDEYGVVQGHVRDALIAILELKKILETIEKSSQSSTSLSKLHQSLYFEVKSSLYRIGAAYGNDLLTLSLSTEQEMLMLGFIKFEE